jgi:GH25 family lysozyme M1 (1,4-beta-N-acetylmuramidase)
MKNYQLVLDIWEADVNLDVKTLLDAGITGLIVRLNDMNGGHHMDEKFASNWQLAKQFPTQSIYFVYNPWVKGLPNYKYLSANLPADATCRICQDIEVEYPDYSPAAYANEIDYFLELTSANHPQMIYTCEGKLDLLSRWPKTYDYWWAQYLYSVQSPLTPYKISWDELRERIDKLPDQPTNAEKCPGKIKLWQIADHLILPGFNGRAVDINVFPGTLDELKSYFGSSSATQTEIVVHVGTEITDEGISYHVLVDMLNIRSGPGVNYQSVGTLHQGDIVTALDVGGSDCWISTERGYVCAIRSGIQFLQKG